MREVTFSHKACDDLEAIWNYSAARWGDAQAEIYITFIEDTCRRLAEGTQTGRDAGDVRSGYFRLRCSRHVLFYREIDRDRIEIVRILHERMDMPGQLGDAPE